MEVAYIIRTEDCITYFNNKHLFHRIDGPAVDYLNGTKHWYINGNYILVHSQEEFERYLKLMVFR